MQSEPKFPTKGINKHVSNYIRKLPDLTGKVVLDIPCGDGRASYEFYTKGAIIKAYDLYPEFMQFKNVKAEFVDISEGIPLANNSVDYIICQEGIEHLSDQIRVFQEFNRILKKDGQLIITTPSLSYIRARLARFFIESDYWKRMPPTEIDSIWFAEQKTERLYYGHLFMLGIHNLQTIISITGFKVKKRIKTDFSNTSIGLGVILYPIFIFITLLSWLIYQKKNKHIEKKIRRNILWERVKLNLSPITLFCKHIFWVLNKEHTNLEITKHLKLMKNDIIKSD